MCKIRKMCEFSAARGKIRFITSSHIFSPTENEILLCFFIIIRDVFFFKRLSESNYAQLLIIRK